MISQQIPLIPTSTYTTKIKTQAGLSLWQTRHSQVLKFIESHNVNAMVDFGSSQCMLLQKVQRGLLVRQMIGVDIDLNVMPIAIENLKPETIQQDLQFQRDFDQIVQLRHGNLVTLVEVIQHIEEKYLQQLNENVFGFLRPTFVWMSTPNSQFNPLFNWEKGRKYRHDDHKFQWTRAQFQRYVDNICQKYNYRATITGVGESFFEEHKNKGFCSQIAIFQRLNFSFDKMPRQFNNQSFKISQLLPTQDPQVPLKTVYKHTNYCWLSNKDHLITVALKEVIYKLNDSFVPWSKVLGMLKKKTIFKKLGQYDDIWHYEYFIKQYLINNITTINQLSYLENGIQKSSYKQQIMDEQMFELNLDKMELQVNENKQKNNISNGPVLYYYDVSTLPQRKAKNLNNNKNEEQDLLDSSQQNGIYSNSRIQSASSQNSWQSIQLPDQLPKKKVPKKRKRNFKPRKSNEKEESLNQN